MDINAAALDVAISRRQLAGGEWKVSVTVDGRSVAVRMFDDEPDDFEVGEWLLSIPVAGRDADDTPPRNAEFIIPEGDDPVPAAAGEGGGAPDDDEGPF